MRRASIAVLTWLFFSLSSLAHHGTAGSYDFNVISTIEGEVTSVFWRNPHVRLTLDVVGEDGETQEWDVESGSLNSLERLGYGRGTIEVGDHVVVTGAKSTRGLNTMAVVIAELPDGSEAPLWPQRLFAVGREVAPREISDNAAQASAQRARGIFRVWSRTESFQTTTTRTAQAITAREQWNNLTDDPALACIPPGMPGMMDNPFPIEFIDEGDEIVLRLEEWDGVRTIHLTGDENAAAQPATRSGYSAGRWEGNTLVVLTARIDYPYYDDSGTPQSEAVEVIERFTLSEDERRLDYAALITDAENLAEPATIQGYWAWIPGEEVKSYNCALPGQ